MNGSLASVVPILPQPEANDRLEQWQVFLAGKIDPQWRKKEWDSTNWLFTGDPDNPLTAAYLCLTPGCQQVLPSQESRCQTCREAVRNSGLSEEEFNAEHRRAPQRLFAYTPPSTCIAGTDSERCRRPAASRGLCRSHYGSWSKIFRRIGVENTDENLIEWAATVAGLDPLPRCAVTGCPLDSVVRAGLCGTHYERWKKAVAQSAKPVTAEVWAATAVPYLTGAQFSLAGLSPAVRLELLFGLQCRDGISARVIPRLMRPLVAKFAGMPSLIMGVTEQDVLKAASGQTNAAFFCRQTLRYLRVAFDEFNGIDPTQREIWDLAALGIGTNTKRVRRRAGTADFTQIRQTWLRNVAMEWARSTRPNGHRLSVRLQACTLASRALTVRPGEGMEPAELQFADMTAIADYFSTLRKQDGSESGAVA